MKVISEVTVQENNDVVARSFVNIRVVNVLVLSHFLPIIRIIFILQKIVGK